MNESNISTAFIILNYRNSQVTIDCIKSIKETVNSNYYLIIIDNGSNNNSLDFIISYFNDAQDSLCVINSSDLKNKEIDKNNSNYLIQSSINLGYAAGNNIGLKFAYLLGIEYTVVLNSDTIVISDFIDDFISKFQSDPNIALISPLIVNEEDIIDRNCLRKRRKIPLSIFYEHGIFRPLLRLIFRDDIKYLPFDPNIDYNKTEVLSGSCFMVDLEWFRENGYFDTDTFLYEEEHILYEKVRTDNKLVLISNKHQLIHIGGESIDVLTKSKVSDYYLKSLYIYLVKYRNIPCLLASIIIYYIKLSDRILRLFK